MKKITSDFLDDLAIGAAILGSGGGGEVQFPHMMASYVMDKFGPASMISLSELQANDLVLPVGVIGAPLAETEKIPNGHEFEKVIQFMEKALKKKVTAVMPFEIGGGNAFCPMMIAPILGIPIVDADTMGRAFPQAQMSSCGLLGVSCTPGIITDCLGHSVVIDATNSLSLEKLGRHAAIAMGSTASFGLFPMTGDEAKTMTIPKSISRASAIGKAYKDAKKAGHDPLDSILHSCKGTTIGSGKITDIDRSISQGFLKGNVVVEGEGQKIEIFFQNEFLLVKADGKVMATTPDIITLLEIDTGMPISSETLQYGIKVNVVAIPGPQVWTTPEGLALVGPRRFGYEMDYVPFNRTKNTVNTVGAFA